jgi:hypothetical protein
MSINPDRIHAARRKIAEVSTIEHFCDYGNLINLFRYHVLRHKYFERSKYSTPKHDYYFVLVFLYCGVGSVQMYGSCLFSKIF